MRKIKSRAAVFLATCLVFTTGCEACDIFSPLVTLARSPDGSQPLVPLAGRNCLPSRERLCRTASSESVQRTNGCVPKNARKTEDVPKSSVLIPKENVFAFIGKTVDTETASAREEEVPAEIEESISEKEEEEVPRASET